MTRDIGLVALNVKKAALWRVVINLTHGTRIAMGFEAAI